MRIAIATCERPPVPDADAPPVAAELDRLGVEAEEVAWSDPSADWSRFDRVWISSTWDYHQRLDEFRGWLNRVHPVTEVENPPHLVGWNLDKRYLRQLGEAGVPVIPTIWTDAGDPAGAATEAAGRGWERVIVKPTVDIGAMNLALVDPAGVGPALARIGAPSLVQPFLTTVQSEGELSLVYLRGGLSHAVRKVPREGDFRVQDSYGARWTLEGAGPEAEAVAAPVLELLGGRGSGGAAPLYCRVDLVRGLDGGLCVIEVELIEPNLYLGVAGDKAAARFASLLAA
ncbi:MAG TPA: hypothetical protein VHH72_01130 [Solirubrobacterales bacterium]|jgi:hypothetical protein|nr:hypothetical protein [Solirubrobacterales bacterium]